MARSQSLSEVFQQILENRLMFSSGVTEDPLIYALFSGGLLKSCSESFVVVFVTVADVKNVYSTANSGMILLINWLIIMT